jgi:hypothetical protein
VRNSFRPTPYEGWRYIIEKTGQKPGIDPAEATQPRQEELDVRESRAMQETKNSTIPSVYSGVVAAVLVITHA